MRITVGGKGTKYPICNSYERNIMVDVYANARLCFSTAFLSVLLEKRGDLGHLWEHSDVTRVQMRRCTRCCGISHSVRRESATLRTTANGFGTQVIHFASQYPMTDRLLKLLLG